MIDIEKIRSIAPNATATANASVTRSMPDTLDQARIKVVKKLQTNVAYVNNNMQPVNSSQKPDLVFKLTANSTYKVGAKYGNRWLPDLFDDGNKFVENIEKAELVSVLEAFVKAIESKQADDAIAVVQEQHKVAHSKAA